MMSKGIAFLVGVGLSSTILAQSIEMIGGTPVTISISHPHNSRHSSVTKKVIDVQHIRLSEEAQEILKKRFSNMDYVDKLAQYELSAPAVVNLGMNNTPVLDQGVHGSCATFANIGAIDAVIGKGDYVSQLCSLELGSYLKNQGLQPYSGWDGSFGPMILHQLKEYGLISIAYQHNHGCAGVKDYPVDNVRNHGKPMSISEYTANSFALANYVSWRVLLSNSEAFSPNYNPEDLLESVKTNLRAGKRITFSILLNEKVGDSGALGTHMKTNDTWILTPKIIATAKNGKFEASHEMIITGYNDNAIAKSPSGVISKGLLLLRNSWGPNAGNQGTYYVSYEYFKALCDEAQVIIPTH